MQLSLQIFTMINEKPLTPLLVWLCEEQADITGKELAEVSGIAPQTWSKVRQGKQDLSSDLLWRVLKAIALLRPNSDSARVVALVEGKKFSRQRITLSSLIASADESELEGAMLQIVARLFPKGDAQHRPIASDRVKSPIAF